MTIGYYHSIPRGDRAPLTIKLAQPLTEGDRLEIELLDLLVIRLALTGEIQISRLGTRLRLPASCEISVCVYRANGVTEKEKINILVGQGENVPETGTGTNVVQQERSEHQISLMFENPMARQDFLRQVHIKTACGTATFELSTYCSANPFLRIDTVAPLGEIEIEAA